MQATYALPFVLLSLVGFVTCLLVPRFRPFAIQALVVPVAFGVGSTFLLLVGVGALNAGHLHFHGILELFSDAEGILLYVNGGAIGVCLAVLVVNRLERRTSR